LRLKAIFIIERIIIGSSDQTIGYGKMDLIRSWEGVKRQLFLKSDDN